MKSILYVATLLGMALGAEATSLTSANFAETVGAKNAFIKFQAPWWGHCKAMKPAWDQLMKAHANHEHVVVGDVDCTDDKAKDLCSKYGVKGYPTIKYFTGATGADGEDYKGGRDFDGLNTFVADSGTFGPSCDLANVELCSDDQKTFLESANAKSAEDLATEIETLDAEFEAIETNFKDSVQKLQDTYTELMKTKEDDAAAFKEKNPHLGLLKAVKSSK